MLSLLASSLIVFSSKSFAAKPACTLAGLTDNCKLFEKYGKQPVIKLPDGTSFRNPLAEPPMLKDPEMATTGPEGEGEQEPEPASALQIEDMRLQQKVMDIFEKLSAKAPVNSAFKTEFVSLMPVPDQILLWAGKRMVYPPGLRVPNTDRVSITWPPNDPQATRKTVATADIVKWLNQLPAPFKTQMKAVFSSRATIKVAYLNSPEAMMPPPPMLTTSKPPKRIVDLFEFSQKALVDEIAKGRAFESLNDAERSAINRIKSINFQIQETQSPACQAFGGSPSYEAHVHLFTLCKSNLNFPNALLVRLIAHEIMHSFDPCTQTLPFYKVDQSALSKLSGSVSNWPEDLRKDRNLPAILQQYATTPNIKNAILDDRIKPASRDALIKLGILKAVDNGFPLTESPAKEAYTCLRDAGFKEVAESDVEKIANRVFGKVTADLSTASDRSKFVSVLQDTMKPHAQCLRGVPGVHSHMGEVMCDAWSGKVLAKWFDKNRPKTVLEKVSSFGVEAASACDASVQKALDNPGKFSLSSIPVVTSETLELHPPWKPRAEKILFSDPGMQAVLGCEPDPMQNCLSKMGASAKSAGATTRSIRSTQPERTSK